MTIYDQKHSERPRSIGSLQSGTQLPSTCAMIRCLCRPNRVGSKVATPLRPTPVPVVSRCSPHDWVLASHLLATRGWWDPGQGRRDDDWNKPWEMPCFSGVSSGKIAKSLKGSNKGSSSVQIRSSYCKHGTGRQHYESDCVFTQQELPILPSCAGGSESLLCSV